MSEPTWIYCGDIFEDIECCQSCHAADDEGGDLLAQYVAETEHGFTHMTSCCKALPILKKLYCEPYEHYQSCNTIQKHANS